ncbi:MAG TPA: hypothetical protein VGK10_19515 [Prolixibacteraceae bacterium]|jgi:hypothetical protein
MKIKIIIFILAFMGILNILFIYFHIKNVNNNILINQKTIEIDKLKFENLKNKYFLEIKDNFFPFDPNMKIISIQGDTLLFKEILSPRPKLIFSFSKLTCSSCVEKEILRIKNIESTFGFDNIIILTNYEHIRDIAMFCKLNNVKYPMYLICKGLNLNVYQNNLAHYFVVFDDFYLRDMYIVDQNSPDLTNKYLDEMLLKYFTYK